MNPERIRALIVDRSQDDVLRILAAITVGNFEIVSRTVEDAAALREELATAEWDVVISDYATDHLSSAEALGIVQDADDSIPFIVVAAADSEAAALALMQDGARDCVTKDNLARLLPAIARETRAIAERRRRDTEEASIRELHERLLVTVEQAPVGIINVAPDGRFLDANPRFCEMLGYSHDELMSLRAQDVTHPDDLVRDLPSFDRMHSDELKQFRTEKRYLRKDGQAVWVSLNSSAIRDVSGHIRCTASVAVDITEKRQAEETVRRQKRDLEEAQRIAHVGSWRRRLPDGNIEWSDELYKIYGYEPGGVTLSLDWLRNTIVPEDRETVAAIFARAQNGMPIYYQHRIERPDGTRRFLHTSGEIVRNDRGEPTEIVGATQDVTERVAAAEAREILNRHMQLLLQSTTQGIFGLDLDGRCTFINRAAAEALGYRSDELVGAAMHDLVHHTRPDGTPYPAGDCPVDAAARGGGKMDVQDDTLWRRDGTSFPVEFSAAPILDRGIVAGAVVVFTDVSERKLLQAQLEQVDRLSSLGRLAATIAHEFNNVLMGIQPFAELLSRQRPDESVQRATAHILRAVQRGRSVTQGILRFTKPAEPVKETVDVAEWLPSLEGALSAILGSDIPIRITVEGEKLLIRGDRHQLEQVLTNLAVNARDAMNGRGELAISAERGVAGQTFPFGTVRAIETYLHLCVSDNGSGMDAKTLKHIFDPFFTTKRSGTGLGLAVVHQIVQLHGGGIFAESVAGKGSVFHLFLPLTEEALIVARPAREAFVRTAVESVLLVEDDAAIGEGLSILLESEGIHVTVAVTGAEAMRRLASDLPEVVILDLGLPDIDGRKLYERIAEVYPELPVIFASGNDDAEMVRPYLKAGRVEALTKPYDFESLLALLGTMTLH
jgi:PAS domain S-box-containing protein